MSISTYGELKTAVAAWSTYSDITSVIPDFVTWAHQEICRRCKANVMLATADLTISAQTIAQPTGFISIKYLYLDTSDKPDLDVVPSEVAGRMGSQYASLQYPLAVSVQGANLYFSPAFTASPTGKLLYYKKPTTLSLDADTNVILTEFPYLYLFGALEAAYNYKEDAEMADRYGGRFGALIEDINSRDAASQMGGAIRTTSAPGGIV